MTQNTETTEQVFMEKEKVKQNNRMSYGKYIRMSREE